MKSGLDIVIVSYRGGAETKRVLEDAGTLAGCDTTITHFDNTGNPKNLSQAWNDCARAGTFSHIAFLNNDAIPSPGWGRRLMRALDLDSTVGAIVPHPVLGPECMFLGKQFAMVEPPDRQFMKTVSEHACRLYPEVEPLHKYSEGNPGFYSVVFRRPDFDRLKGFDERFRLYGQDREICERLRKRGMMSAIARACPFYSGRSVDTQKAIHHGDIDIENEYEFCTRLTEDVRHGRVPRWDTLSDAERIAVRLNPAYKIPKRNPK